MSYIDRLKDRVAGVLYKNLAQWKLKIGNPQISPTELKQFIIQELGRMELEIVEYNQLLLQREFSHKNNQTDLIAEKDAQITQLFQNNLRLMALLQCILTPDAPKSQARQEPPISQAPQEPPISQPSQESLGSQITQDSQEQASPQELPFIDNLDAFRIIEKME